MWLPVVSLLLCPAAKTLNHALGSWTAIASTDRHGTVSITDAGEELLGALESKRDQYALVSLVDMDGVLVTKKGARLKELTDHDWQPAPDDTERPTLFLGQSQWNDADNLYFLLYRGPIEWDRREGSSFMRIRALELAMARHLFIVSAGTQGDAARARDRLYRFTTLEVLQKAAADDAWTLGRSPHELLTNSDSHTLIYERGGADDSSVLFVPPGPLTEAVSWRLKELLYNVPRVRGGLLVASIVRHATRVLTLPRAAERDMPSREDQCSGGLFQELRTRALALYRARLRDALQGEEDAPPPNRKQMAVLVRKSVDEVLEPVLESISLYGHPRCVDMPESLSATPIPGVDTVTIEETALVAESISKYVERMVPELSQQAKDLLRLPGSPTPRQELDEVCANVDGLLSEGLQLLVAYAEPKAGTQQPTRAEKRARCELTQAAMVMRRFWHEDRLATLFDEVDDAGETMVLHNLKLGETLCNATVEQGVADFKALGECPAIIGVESVPCLSDDIWRWKETDLEDFKSMYAEHIAVLKEVDAAVHDLCLLSLESGVKQMREALIIEHCLKPDSRNLSVLVDEAREGKNQISFSEASLAEGASHQCPLAIKQIVFSRAGAARITARQASIMFSLWVFAGTLMIYGLSQLWSG